MMELILTAQQLPGLAWCGIGAFVLVCLVACIVQRANRANLAAAHASQVLRDWSKP